MTEREALKARLEQSLHRPVATLQRPGHARLGRPLAPLRRARLRLLDAIFERGLDTAALEVEIDHFHPENVTYQPSDWRCLSRGLAGRGIQPDDVFVDFGSGKGRIVCQAATYPFRRVVGVEISPRLNAIARQNLKLRRGRLTCTDVELVTADATGFEVPDDMTVAYIYHPFTGATFRAVAERIVESLDRRPRLIRLIYACPGDAEQLLATGRFSLTRRSRGGLFDALDRRVMVFESLSLDERNP